MKFIRVTRWHCIVLLVFVLLCTLFTGSAGCGSASVQAPSATPYAGDNFTTWEDARLGIFIHWSHSSQQGVELSWPLVGGTSTMPYCQSMTVDQYQSSAATFNPQKWDPVALASSANRGCAPLPLTGVSVNMGNFTP